MSTASKLVSRYRSAKEAPPAKYVALLRRTMSGHPEYGFLPNFEAPHTFTYKAATNFSLGMADLKILLRAGLMKIQVNEPGHITLYFGPTGSEETPGLVDFVQMGRDAFARGDNSSAGRAEITSLAQKTPGINILKALTDWAHGWHEANVAAPVPGL